MQRVSNAKPWKSFYVDDLFAIILTFDYIDSFHLSSYRDSSFQRSRNLLQDSITLNDKYYASVISYFIGG